MAFQTSRARGVRMNYEYRIKRIRNIIKRVEEKEGANMADWLDAFERIKVECR